MSSCEKRIGLLALVLSLSFLRNGTKKILLCLFSCSFPSFHSDQRRKTTTTPTTVYNTFIFSLKVASQSHVKAHSLYSLIDFDEKIIIRYFIMTPICISFIESNSKNNSNNIKKKNTE